MRLAPVTWVALSVGFASMMSCGKPANEGADAVRLKGHTGFGSICPEGTFSAPRAKQLQLFDCPLGLESVELAEPVPSLILQADCKEKILTVRSEDRSFDTSWEVMPNGSFNLTFGAGYAKLKDDGKGHFNCTVPLTMDVWGKMECAQANRDRADIKIETVWWMNKPLPDFGIPAASPSPNPPPVSAPQPSASPSARPSPRPLALGRAAPIPAENRCTVPSSCYLHAKTLVKQCQ